MKKYISNFLIAITAIFAVACDFNDSPDNGMARVNFYLVDAPGDFDEVWVEVLAVRVRMKSDNSDENDDSSWREMNYEPGDKMVNLLDLTGNNSLLLGTEDFEEGEIDQIRLVLGENNYVVSDGNEFDLKTPSAQQSGLKIKVNQPIEGGQSYNLVIDFDVAKSIVVAGNSGNIILKPVLRAYLEEAAGISGLVLPLDAQTIAVSASRNGESFNTFTDEAGNFKIQGLEPGTYTILITPNERYTPVSLEAVVVEQGEITVLDPVTVTLKEE